METPLVSVIVPIYKVEPYLAQCVDSIINQTYKNLEIILVDDGSPDNCPKMCDEYAKKDSRIVVIHKENGGLSDARNVGLDIAKGDWITFVDSDDWIADNFVETLQKAASDYQADIAIASYHEEPNGASQDSAQSFKLFTSHELLWHLCASDVKGLMSAWGKLFQKSCFSAIRFPFGKLYEDAHINYKLYFNASKIYYSPKELYHYRIRPDSIMGKTTSSTHALEPLLQRYKFLRDHGESEAANCNLELLCGDVLFAYSEAKLYQRYPSGFNDAEMLLELYQEIVKDYFNISHKKRYIYLFHKFFSKHIQLYLFYRKNFPLHLRKN